MGTIAICDSEPIAVEGLRVLLERIQGWRIVAAENCLADAMEAVSALAPGLVILDKAFGLEAVVECLHLLRRWNSRTCAVVWGTALSEAEAVRCVRAGASGVVRKTAALEDLAECLRAVLNAGSWIEDGLIPTAEPRVTGPGALTTRELEVMEGVKRGLRNKDIAADLGIRVGTVKIHLKHIFEKTGIRGRYGLALAGLRENRMPLALTM